MDFENQREYDEWASSLVGRDWEIFWNENEDKTESKSSTESQEDRMGKNDMKTKETEGNGDDNDSDSDGSIIDDWYAGNVLSKELQDNAKYLFKVHFVGDEEVYDMFLEPSKVRPSARGWIKRTKAILCESDVTIKDGKSWEERLPPTTCTIKDADHLRELEKAIMSKKLPSFLVFDSKPSDVEIPSESDLDQALRLKFLLQSQTYLRSRLANIVNHHGSSKYIDGEPNPREAYVDHLVDCCRDLEKLCDWYLKGWSLVTSVFSGNIKAWNKITTDSLVEEFLGVGRELIINCATMDVSPTASKRRQIPSPSAVSRRPKRRRKNTTWGSNKKHQLENFLSMTEDLRCSSYVNEFVRSVYDTTHHWFLLSCSKVMNLISQSVVDLVMKWKLKFACMLGDTSEQENELDEENRSDAEDDNSSTSSRSEQFHRFNFEEILAHREILKKNIVFDLVDLEEEKKELDDKLEQIESIASKAINFINRLAEDMNIAPGCTGDDVLNGLQMILQAASSSESSIYNVEPIGRSAHAVSRASMQAAVDIRRWLIKVNHSEQVRERSTFIEELKDMIPRLPKLEIISQINKQTEIQSTLKAFEAKIIKRHSSLLEYEPIFEKYEKQVSHDSSRNVLMDYEAARKVFDELSKCDVLSIAEEKICIRLDILDWKKRAEVVMEANSKTMLFDDLCSLSTSLKSILSGNSCSRNNVLNGVQQNDEVDNLLKSFASADSRNICGELIEDFQSLHSKVSKWKERAESTIFTLRLHGNLAVGGEMQAIKLPAMIDLKRVIDLLEEYESMKVEILGFVKILKKVNMDASEWVSKVETIILDNGSSLDKCYSLLLAQRDQRPRGIIMDPTRHIYDSWLDMFVWYKRTNDSIIEAVKSLRSRAREEPDDASVHSKVIVDYFYPVLAEGIDIVDAFSTSSGVNNLLQIDRDKVLHVLEGLYDIRRSARALSRDKIESNILGESIFSRIIQADLSGRGSCPLLFLSWVKWHLVIANFVSPLENGNNEDDVSSDVRTVRSLLEAKELMRLEPRAEKSHSEFVQTSRLLMGTKSFEVVQLECLIHKADTIESEIRSQLSSSKNMLRGGVEKVDLVRQHLQKLKQSLSLLKSWLRGDEGLSLNPSFEPQLEHHIKVFSWLVRTYTYPILHLDEASYSATNNAEGSHERVPWDIVVSLYDRIPADVEENVGDFALVALRVRDLYEAGKRWQDEITRNTRLSIRGGKRRAQSASSQATLAKVENERDTASGLQMERMKQLAGHPILSKVAMPREGAVNGIIRDSNQFEVQLFNFLGEDYDGIGPDRALFPDSASLVGKRGEFILYRLTGGPVFESLQSSMHSLSIVGENLLAETPGKAAFDWIESAVSWIECLNESVTTDSPFVNSCRSILVIPSVEARKLLKDGEVIFLNVPEDLRKTLSKHGIFVSTNKQERALRVILKKHGAHHSVGGTVIRWCPVLFDSLRADIRRLDEWEKTLTQVLSRFNTFFSQTRHHLKGNENDLYQWYCFREQVSELLKDGRESLVVAPQEGLVGSFQNLLTSIENYLRKHSTPSLDSSFAKRWFAQSTSMLGDRFLLLDSLVYRQNLIEKSWCDDASSCADFSTPNRTFRDACRSYLEKCFAKALKVIGLTCLPATNSNTELKSLCSIKAWEIESEMFAKFQGEFGLSRVSEAYRNKARNLRCSLEDVNNASLCIRLLLSDLSVERLVSMSSDQLASHKSKLERARAKEEATTSVLLTPATENKKTANGTAPDEISGQSLRLKEDDCQNDIQDDTIAVSNSSKDDSWVGQDSSVSKDEVGILVKPQSALALKTHEMPLNPDDGGSLAVRAMIKPVSKTAPPPPPPSLVRSFQTQIEPSPHATQSRDRGTRVLNSSRGERFRVEIMNPRSLFCAAFYAEKELQETAHSVLPESLLEKGRLRINEFSRFLANKLSGGKWSALPLRLTPLSDQDAREYKKFYKEYELKQRIAMFSVGQNSKLFLVTPKFHGAATKMGYVSFLNKTSTYAVILSKENVFMN